MRELEVNFVSDTCTELLRKAIIKADDIRRGEKERVSYVVEERSLRIGDEPVFFEVVSGEAGKLLGLDEAIRVVFNDPAVAETERCCFMDKIDLARSLAEALIEGDVEGFVEEVKGLPKHALLEFSGDPRYEPVALVPSPV